MAASGSSFVGRDADLSAIDEIFDRGGRLVTLLGPAGVGKTRLARVYAETRAARFERIVFGDLASARSPADLLSTLSRALDTSLSASSTVDEAIETIASSLRGFEGLIILDNVEQIVDTAPLLSQALIDRSEARILVTSQERLRLERESVLDLLPLSAEAARALFVDRACAIRHGYDPSSEYGAIDQICAELDRLPLAIELAAARMRVVTAPELLARLGERLDVAGGRDRDRIERHASLRSALDWSWSLLDAEERSTLAQCSVFDGGFDLDAAESVIETKLPVLDALHALRDKSLLRMEDTPIGARFDLYLAIRDYARERLAEVGAGPVDARHTDHYVTRGFLWAARSEGVEGPNARAHLEAEQANILAVHRRSVRAGDAEPALRTAIILQPILIARGPASLRLSMLESALEVAGGKANRRLLGWVRLARGDTLFGMGEMAESQRMFDLAREDAIAEGDERLRGRATWRTGTLEWARDRIEALATLERALEIHRNVGDRIHEGRCLSSLGIFALEQGDLEAAGDRFEEAFTLGEQTGDDRWVARAIGHLGAVEDARGNVVEARQLYLQAIQAHERLGNRRHLAQVLGALGALDTELGDLDRARASFEAALAIRKEVPNRRTEGVVLMLYGTCHELAKEPILAVRCYREAASIHRSIGSLRLSAFALLHLARVEAMTGKVSAARSKLEEVLRNASDPDAQLRGLTDIVRGHIAIASGDVAEAERCLDGAREVAGCSALLRRGATVLRTALGDGLPVDALVVGKGWFKVPRGKKIDIGSRKAPSLLLAALADARRKSPGISLTVDELFAAGWPGERALPSSAASRVYVAISTLRKLGLEAILIRDDAGYRLDPAIPLTPVLDGF